MDNATSSSHAKKYNHMGQESNSCTQIFSQEMDIHTHSVLYQNNISVYQLSSQVLLKGDHCLSFPNPFLAVAIIAHSSW